MHTPFKMKTTIETTQLEFGKSNFLISLIKHESGLLYVEMIQKLIGEEGTKSTININPGVLSDIINVLQNYHAKISLNPAKDFKHLTDSDQLRIQEWYLKGLSIKDLAMQFDQTPELIEMILRNKGIEIVDQEVPKKCTYLRKNYKRKKK